MLGHRSWTPGLALVADRFADRRVFLAGDAAHLFTPTGGFGMNTGVDDVANLSWKLAARLAGWGGPDLLASYECERRPVAERNTAAARRLNMNLGKLRLGPLLEQSTLPGRRERERVGGLLSMYGEQFASIGVQLGARYDGSPVIAADSDPPPDSCGRLRADQRARWPRPHAWRRGKRDRGDSLFDLLGPGFTLLRLGTRPAAVTGMTAAAERAGVPLTVLELPAAHIRDMYERDLV